jgi:hypothetical protein
MTGLPVETDPNTGQTNVLNTNYVTRSQGASAQSWAGTVLAANNSSVANASSAQLPGSPNPADKTAGYLAAGQPEGSNATVIVPNTDGNSAAGATLQTVGTPAGTAGGGGVYPNIAGASAVPNPMIKPAWSVQVSNVFIEFSYAPFTALHATAQTVTPSLALVNGTAGTFTVTVKEVNGVLGAALPAAFTLAPATGVITIANTSVTGVTTIGLTVTDSSGRTAEASVTITLT